MRVQSITVSCFRSFGEQQNMLQVNPGVTTIVGMNGSGIPSTGAENIKHLCSILLGWGFRFVALFDYDNEGKKCCRELEKELLLRYMSGFMMLKNIPAAEYDALQKIDADSAVVLDCFCVPGSSSHVSRTKPNDNSFGFFRVSKILRQDLRRRKGLRRWQQMRQNRRFFLQTGGSVGSARRQSSGCNFLPASRENVKMACDP